MKLLAVDVSSVSGSVALFDEEELVAEFNLHLGGRHSATLLTAIDRVCSAGNIEVGEVDAFAVTNGPGSFTGLRVGISVVKGLAWSAGKPVVGVSTLMALAMNVPCAGGIIAPVLNARRGEVYGGFYRWEGGTLRAATEDCSMTPEVFVEKAGGDALFLGDGLDICGPLIETAHGGACLAPPSLWSIRASNVGRLGRDQREAGVDASHILPLYKRGMAQGRPGAS